MDAQSVLPTAGPRLNQAPGRSGLPRARRPVRTRGRTADARYFSTPRCGPRTWPPASTYPASRASALRRRASEWYSSSKTSESMSPSPERISTSDPSASILMMCAGAGPPAPASPPRPIRSIAPPGRRSSPRRSCSGPGRGGSDRDRRSRTGRATPTGPRDEPGCARASRNSRGAARSSGGGSPAIARSPRGRRRRCSPRCRGSPGRDAHTAGRTPRRAPSGTCAAIEGGQIMVMGPTWGRRSSAPADFDVLPPACVLRTYQWVPPPDGTWNVSSSPWRSNFGRPTTRPSLPIASSSRSGVVVRRVIFDRTGSERNGRRPPGLKRPPARRP